MLSLILASLVSVVLFESAVVDCRFRCPSPDGQFANPAECKSFYVCTSGRWTLMNCPVDLLYNPTTSCCDWSDNVQCHTGRSPDTSVLSKLVRFPPPGSQFANPANCSTFFLWTMDGETLMNCPENLKYNPESGVCDWDFNVACDV